MKIGLDLDGVVFDSERTFRTYEELFDIKRNQNKLIDRSLFLINIIGNKLTN